MRQAGRPHETLLTAGQTAGGIREILPVAEIMRRLVAETAEALVAGQRLFLTIRRNRAWGDGRPQPACPRRLVLDTGRRPVLPTAGEEGFDHRFGHAERSKFDDDQLHYLAHLQGSSPICCLVTALFGVRHIANYDTAHRPAKRKRGLPAASALHVTPSLAGPLAAAVGALRSGGALFMRVPPAF